MTTEEAIRILYEMLSKTAYGGGELGGLAINMAVEALRGQEKKFVSEELENAAKHNTFKYVFDKHVNQTLVSELKYIGDNCFKDGVRWQMKQGYSKEATIEVHGGVGWLKQDTSVIEVPDDFKDGDKVIVQIRRKED